MNDCTSEIIGVALKYCVSRRGLLRMTAGSGALAGATALLAACGGSYPGSPSSQGAPANSMAKSSGASAVALPAFQPPASAPPPDFPGSADGVVEPGYVNWPKTTYQSVKQAPGDGSQVSVFLNIPGAPPPPMDQNPAWQAWNNALNVKLSFQFYAFADLAPKFATLVAGNELPDI